MDMIIYICKKKQKKNKFLMNIMCNISAEYKCHSRGAQWFTDYCVKILVHKSIKSKSIKFQSCTQLLLV